jgi:hypothetical protein
MLRLSKIIQLRDGERVHAVARRHGVTLASRLLLAGLLIIVPFFFLFALTKWGAVGLIFFAVLEALGVFVALRAFLIWDANVLLVTSQRLVRVDQKGLWKRLVSEIPMAFVQEVECERMGLGEALWHIGTLRIKTSSSPEIVGMVVKKVCYPERLQGLINELRVGGRSSGDRIQNLLSLLRTADQATLNEVERILKNPL